MPSSHAISQHTTSEGWAKSCMDTPIQDILPIPPAGFSPEWQHSREETKWSILSNCRRQLQQDTISQPAVNQALATMHQNTCGCAECKNKIMKCIIMDPHRQYHACLHNKGKDVGTKLPSFLCSHVLGSLPLDGCKMKPHNQTSYRMRRTLRSHSQ